MTIRIGMLTPSSNTCLEPVTYRMLAGVDDVTVHFSRLPVTRIKLDDGVSAQFSTGPMVAAARLLADAQVDVVVWNGTSGSWLGVDRDRELARALREATGVPATTSTLALLDAYRAFGVRRLGLAVPYTEDVAQQIAETYVGQGVSVVSQQYLGLTDNLAFGRTAPERIRTLITDAARGDVHAVAVVCTNVHGAVHAAPLEHELGIPVFDSVTATLWKALDVAGSQQTIGGWGTLLATGRLRVKLQQVCEQLLAATRCDRTTVRLDVPAAGLQVDLTAAEAVRDGVSSIRWDSSLDQRRLDTVEWLEQHRKNLVQPDFHGTPRAPQALREVYGVQAQLLGPVGSDGEPMVGWLSAHSMAERPWDDSDLAAMDAARIRVGALLNQL